MEGPDLEKLVKLSTDACQFAVHTITCLPAQLVNWFFIAGFHVGDFDECYPLDQYSAYFHV